MFSSRASKAPSRPKQEPRESNFFATEDNMAAINGGSPMEIDSRNENEVDRLIISTDFGTTFSCVAFASSKDDIGIVRGYATDPMSIQKKPRFDVPTESWYPTKAKLEELTIERNSDMDEPMLRFDDEDDSDDDDFNDGQGQSDLKPNFMYSGYEVQDKLSEPDLDKKQYNCITRSKLLLDTSYETKKIREELKPVLKTLKARKYIKVNEDVIAQYLEQLFLHAKRYLKDIRRLKDTTIVEHVLCVPVIWSPSACRKMQSAVEIAIEKSELGSIKNMFLVSEPEAAAAYVLEYSESISKGESFILLDAGGGTVDVTTYTVGDEEPLKLKREEVAAKGGLYGSSYLNEAFKEYLFGRLESEKSDLETDGRTIEGIVDQQTIKFENSLKRIMDVTDRNMATISLHIQGLRENPEKGFADNRIKIKRNDFWRMFERCLRGNMELMLDQIKLSREAGLTIKKVVLIGGFSNNPSLRKTLERRLRKLERDEGVVIGLETVNDPEYLETAMASGGILRALDKENDGLERISLCSYGFFLQEEHDPIGIPAHKKVKPMTDSSDGVPYLEVMDWVVKKGEVIPAAKEYRTDVHFIFPATRKTFIYEQQLYVSDTSTEQHYKFTHPKNRGAQIVGTAHLDFGELIRSGAIQETIEQDGLKLLRYYRVDFELVMKVKGRNLEIKGCIGGESFGGQEVSIAAAFVPGTK
ncbi:uncharacterized protein EAE97_010437 [Botrytis byssoidea]|uniref:Uncharacterized protein n=1 Tax=Botrytis byssoidea TaxID=139641 RepID=A0A9P5I5P0_9HELO|nr:uncharacterized protein EAE97_010437 [Botrytis byssoidea]KAF7926137.1 hypothetical protein EAE97_010437 [Botrytis byssoidea]